MLYVILLLLYVRYTQSIRRTVLDTELHAQCIVFIVAGVYCLLKYLTIKQLAISL